MSDLRRPLGSRVNFIPHGKPRDGDVPQPGDEQISDYTRERLLRMDQKFMARVERALECGVESLPAMSGFVEPRRR